MSTVPPHREKDIRNASKAAHMSTANGEVAAAKTVDYALPALEGRIQQFLLESTPDVISIGRRCVREGWAFHWEPRSAKPYLISPKGVRVNCMCIHDVPYLMDYRSRADNKHSERVRDLVRASGEPADASAPARPRS